jgi:hypothetical protein
MIDTTEALLIRQTGGGSDARVDEANTAGVSTRAGLSACLTSQDMTGYNAMTASERAAG